MDRRVECSKAADLGLLSVTLESTKSVHYNGENSSDKRVVVFKALLEKVASVPRSSAFVKVIPYFLDCSNIDESECDDRDDGFGNNEINSSLFGEMLSQRSCRECCFLDSTNFYNKYCEETAGRREAEDLMILTLPSQQQQP